jgi:TolB-like protein
LEVDQQTDLFSFGALLYELLSGASPFAAGTASDIIVAVLTRDPPPLKGVPPAVADIIARALQKDRAQRYATAAELLLDLTNAKQALDGGRATPAARHHADTPPRLVTAGSTATPRAMTSLAVLPFANMSADVDNEHFCDGLAEELLNALSKIDALKVAARTSAFSFKGKNVDVGTIARTLGVTSVLDGSIRRSGNRLRISVQLVNAADGYQVWSERYDREMRDVFELQDEITLAVVAALKLKLFGEERAAVLKRYTDNAEAYELFLKGRHHSYKYTAQGWQRAIEFFEKAIALEPDYALAYAGIAASRGCQWFFGILPAEQVIPQCKAASARERPSRL